jgi:hypothetical protein
MRLFQNSSLYPSYVRRLRSLSIRARTFGEHIDVLLADRYGAQHLLLPVLDRQPWAFFANGDDELVQRTWARENGLPEKCSPAEILRAQVEAHRTEIFYNQDPLRFGSAFLRTLPDCVRVKIGWRAAPSPGADFGGYDLMVCNFPSILEEYRRQGLRAAYFSPAFDPEMAPYAATVDRPVDLLFVGGYTRHHRRRAELLEAVAGLGGDISVSLHLDASRLTLWAESLPGRVLLPSRHRRPAAIRRVARAPVFGRDLYAALGRAKIVLNGAIDMAGSDRGNLRCFEAIGCGAALLSDAGRYPDGMSDGTTMATYEGVEDALARIRGLLADPQLRQRLATAGHEMLRTRYDKATQWRAFQALAQ